MKTHACKQSKDLFKSLQLRDMSSLSFADIIHVPFFTFQQLWWSLILTNHLLLNAPKMVKLSIWTSMYKNTELELKLQIEGKYPVLDCRWSDIGLVVQVPAQ